MRLVRVVVALLAILALSTASFAGDLRESVEKAAQQEANIQPSKIDRRYAWPGAVLFASGMAMALYGFLHTSGGEFVSGEVSKESHTGIGAAGLGIAAAGGTILYLGAERSRHAPSIAVGPGRVTVAKRLSW